MKRRAAPLVILGLVLVGCGSAEKHEESVSTPSAAHIAETEHAEAAATTTTTDPPPTGITGFGATNEAWNGAHTEDTNYDREAAYNANSELPAGAKDEYDDVTHTNGHVTGYEYHFASESAREAQSAILHEQFPADATIFHYEALNTCAIMLVRSTVLTQALGLPAGTPAAQISLEASPTETGEEPPFDPSNVDTAIVSEGYRGIENITGGKC